MPNDAPADARLAIDYARVADLVPYARNARTHSDRQVAQIAASIREFGWTNPVLSDERGGLIAGHGRLMAAALLGMDAVPRIVLRGLTDEQKRALVLADNKLALNAGWDVSVLGAELADLHAAGYGLDVIGFDAPELSTLMGLDPTSAGFGGGEGAEDTSRHLLMVEFDTEEALEQAFHEAQERGWKAKVMS